MSEHQNAQRLKEKPASTGYWAIVPAAGVGSRMSQGSRHDSSLPKQYLSIGTDTILSLTLERLDSSGILSGIVLVLGDEDDWFEKLDLSLNTALVTVKGGAERMHSVNNGLAALENMAADTDWVMVHDVVRPCVRVEDIQALASTLADDPVGGILAYPVSHTLKKVTQDREIECTVPREQYWQAATPQMFRYKLLQKALGRAVTANQLITDESHAVELAGYGVKMIPCSGDNIKITHREDLMMAEFILSRQKQSQGGQV